jgi:rhodanese-related sulfurtransferase
MIIGGVALIAMLAGALLLRQPPAGEAGSLPGEVRVEQAAQMREQGAFMLDVREPAEWQEFHMPGATLIPLGELAQRVNELPRDREIVVVCRSGNRSAQGRDILLHAGFENVTSMAGGMNEWRASGFPVESGN